MTEQKVVTRQETFSLSGFGGTYEDMCQRMLWRGVAYLAEVKPDPEMWSGAQTYANVYGVMVTEGAELKALEAAILKPGDDATGAMHQCVMGHLAYIHRNGLDEWRTELTKHRTEDKMFVWEGEL